MHTNFALPKEKIEEFCLKWNIVEFSLFGSILRDDFEPESDVDILISLSEKADNDRKLIAEAVKTANNSDAVLLVLGETVVFAREAWSESHRGDRNSLELLGMQNQLAREIMATGKPVIVLLINGRPLAVNEIAKNTDALIEGFYLGQEGGTAVADILFEKINPSGKLAVTIPKSVGELPAYYNRKPLRMRSYIHTENDPLFPFGFGLSYTTFEYSSPVLEDLKEILIEVNNN